VRRLLLAVAVALALAAAVFLAVVLLRDDAPAQAFRGSTPPPGIVLPDFTLRDYTGEVVRSRELRGKVVLVTFLDSQCEESCPIIAGQVARALPLLSAKERAEVDALAITTDPEEDTVGSVREFLRRNRAVGGLRYLLGSERELRPVWNAFSILPSADTGVDELHSAPVRLYDRDGVWLATLHAGADLTPENLAHDLRVALERD